MKIEDSLLLEFQMELQKIITERESMVSQNNYELSRGEKTFYRKEHFDNIKQKILDLHNRLILILEK